MKNFQKICLCAGTALCLVNTATPNQAYAQHEHHADHKTATIGSKDHDHHAHHDNHRSLSPLGVMSDHVHKKGEWMVSYVYRRMNMQGNRQGTSGISPEEIATTVANPNGPPPTLRVVPISMKMDMHMLHAMYGVTDKFTVMAMGMYMDNTMNHITFQGGMGTNVLGGFTTESKGWGDTSVTGIYNIYQDHMHSVNLSLGISIPTGSIDEEDDVLTPMGTRPTLRLPYAMQLGSGTWDALPGITYAGALDNWSWGAQYNATIRMESENSEDYRLGNLHRVVGWSGYQFTPEIGAGLNISAQTLGDINGADPLITAPVQTADPNNYGGEIVEIGTNFRYTPTYEALKGIEFSTDVSIPIVQDLNGTQLERDWSITAGLTYRF